MIYIVHICLDTPHIFGHLHMFGHPPYVWTSPICLDAHHMSDCPPHICMPQCFLVHFMFLGVFAYDMGMGTSINPILSAQKLLQG